MISNDIDLGGRVENLAVADGLWVKALNFLDFFGSFCVKTKKSELKREAKILGISDIK